ncbi:MAG: dihydrofolate reductase [Candidatus Melainabacteria bacterium]|nr:dihydrofolate reductase [Candidatus Melainabacteria bacterium]
MKFRRIVCVDNVNLTPEAYYQLETLSTEPFIAYESDPSDQQEAYLRMADADCALVSWRTRLGDSVLSRCKSLRYIGLCASKYSNPDAGNIDLKAARRRGITVTAVGQYGDEATAEFIFCMLLNLCRGFNKTHWLDMPSELYGKSLGIIGMGAMGRHVMRLALGFGMKVAYFSLTRKTDCEVLGVHYMTKEELLCSNNVVSLHVPKGTHILSAADFSKIPANVVLVNTCLGIVFSPKDFEVWISKKLNVAILDESADPA